MVRSDRLVDVEARLRLETERARCFDVGKPIDVWIPKSQHEWDDGEQKITMPEWLAIDKGLV